MLSIKLFRHRQAKPRGGGVYRGMSPKGGAGDCKLRAGGGG